MQGVTAKSGFVSDGASVSRWFAALGVFCIGIAFFAGLSEFIIFGSFIALVPALFPRTSNYFAATVIHDYCLVERLGTRKEADILFKECLKQLEVSPWRYWPMYFAVRTWAILTTMSTK